MAPHADRDRCLHLASGVSVLWEVSVKTKIDKVSFEIGNLNLQYISSRKYLMESILLYVETLCPLGFQTSPLCWRCSTSLTASPLGPFGSWGHLLTGSSGRFSFLPALPQRVHLDWWFWSGSLLKTPSFVSPAIPPAVYRPFHRAVQSPQTHHNKRWTSIPLPNLHNLSWLKPKL